MTQQAGCENPPSIEWMLGRIADLERQLAVANARIVLLDNLATLHQQGKREAETRMAEAQEFIKFNYPSDHMDLVRELGQAREALNNFSQAFFEFATAAVRDTEEPFIPKHLSDLYGVLVRRAQAAESVLAALAENKNAAM